MSRNDSESQPERYRLKDERNLIGEAVYRKRAYAWISWELAGEKAGGHSLAIWMINETQLLKIRPAVRAGTSRNYQLKRLLGEGLSPQRGSSGRSASRPTSYFFSSTADRISGSGEKR